MEKRAILKLSASVAAVGLVTCGLTGVFTGGELTWQAPPAEPAIRETVPAEPVTAPQAVTDPARFMREKPGFGTASGKAEPAAAGPERFMRTRPAIPAGEAAATAEAEEKAPAENPERFMRARPAIPAGEAAATAEAEEKAPAENPERFMRARPAIPAGETTPAPEEGAERFMRKRPERPEAEPEDAAGQPDADRMMRSKPVF